MRVGRISPASAWMKFSRLVGRSRWFPRLASFLLTAASVPSLLSLGRVLVGVFALSWLSGCANDDQVSNEPVASAEAAAPISEPELTPGTVRVVDFETTTLPPTQETAESSRVIGEEPRDAMEAMVLSTPYFHRKQSLVVVVPLARNLPNGHPDAAWCIPISNRVCARVNLLRAVSRFRFQPANIATKERIINRIGFEKMPDEKYNEIMVAVNDLLGLSLAGTTRDNTRQFELDYPYQASVNGTNYGIKKPVQPWQVWQAELGPETEEKTGEYYGKRPVLILSVKPPGKSWPLRTVTVLVLSADKGKSCDRSDDRFSWGVKGYSFDNTRSQKAEISFALANQIRSISPARLLHIRNDTPSGKGFFPDDRNTVRREGGDAADLSKHQLILDLVRGAISLPPPGETWAPPEIPGPWRWGTPLP